MAWVTKEKRWRRLMLFMTLLSVILELFALITGLAVGQNSNALNYLDVELSAPFVVLGLLGFVVAALMALVIACVNEVSANRVLHTVFIIAASIAGSCTLLGISMWIGDVASPPMINITLGVTASVLALLAAMFGVLDFFDCGTG